MPAVAPWRALNLGLLLQITYNVPLRFTIWQSAWRRFIEAKEERTFMVCNSGLVFGSGDGIYRLVKNCKVISFPEVKLPCFPDGINRRISRRKGRMDWTGKAGSIRTLWRNGGGFPLNAGIRDRNVFSNSEEGRMVPDFLCLRAGAASAVWFMGTLFSFSVRRPLMEGYSLPGPFSPGF